PASNSRGRIRDVEGDPRAQSDRGQALAAGMDRPQGRLAFGGRGARQRGRAARGREEPHCLPPVHSFSSDDLSPFQGKKGSEPLDYRAMDLPPLVDALILGIVEGITEFLPVSSTGHLIVVSDFLGANDEKGKVFDIVIQLGAILAVCWEFRVRVGQAFAGLGRDPVQQRFAANLFVAFLPAAVVGLALQTEIKKYLFNPTSV